MSNKTNSALLKNQQQQQMIALSSSSASSSTELTSSDATLFSKQVPIGLKLNSSIAPQLAHGSSSFIDRLHPCVTVELCIKTNPLTRSKYLDLQLTDEDDPFFLFQLELGEEEFHIVKSEQNLLVDFFQFPYKLMELLDSCIQFKNEEVPKFIAKLSSESSAKQVTFSILETNSFKQINHLSLHLVPGNDGAVKSYLAELTKDLKSENASLKSRLEKLRESSTRSQTSLESRIAQLTQEVEKLKLNHSDSVSKLTLKHQEEVSAQKDKFKAEIQNLKLQSEKEKRILETKHDEEVRELTKNVASLTSAQSHLSSRRTELETALNEANKQAERFQKDINSLKSQKEMLDREIQQLNFEKAAVNKENTSLKIRQDEMAKDYEQVVQKFNDMNTETQLIRREKEQYDEAIQAYQDQISSFEEAIKRASEEINKGNDIIRKLQNELKNVKSKIKLKTTLSLQQEKLLDERAVTIENQQEEIQELKKELTQIKETVKSSQNNLEEANLKLSEQKQKIQDNNNVIEWLHKQLNEQTLGRPFNAEYNAKLYNRQIDENQDSTSVNLTGDGNKDVPVSRGAFMSSMRKDHSPHHHLPTTQLRSKFGASVMASSNKTPSTRLPLKSATVDNNKGSGPAVAKLKSNYF